MAPLGIRPRVTGPARAGPPPRGIRPRGPMAPLGIRPRVTGPARAGPPPGASGPAVRWPAEADPFLRRGGPDVLDQPGHAGAEVALVDRGVDDRPSKLLLDHGHVGRCPLELEQQAVLQEAEGELEPGLLAVVGRLGLVDEVACGFGDRELEVGDLVGGQRGEPADGREGEAGEHEKARLRRDRQGDVAVPARGYRLLHRHLHSTRSRSMPTSISAAPGSHRGARSAATERALSERHLDRAPVVAAHHLEADPLARALLSDEVGEVVARGHGPAVDGHDRVATLGDGLLTLEVDLLAAGREASVVGWAVLVDLHDQRPAAGRDPEPGRELRVDRLRLDAQEPVVHVPVGTQLLYRAAYGVHRHRETDSLAAPGLRLDLRVDPDDPPAGVEQRAAGVARVYGSVGLDRVADLEGGERLDVAIEGRDHADRERLLLAERASDRSHRLTDPQVARRAEPEQRER